MSSSPNSQADGNPPGGQPSLVQLSGVVAHWHNEDEVEELIAAWPNRPEFELIVVDNGSSRPVEHGPARWISAGHNSGFGGAINRAASIARGEVLLILNPDAQPEPGALEQLLAGFDAHPDAAGLAPRMCSPDGSSQFRWQLRALPTAWELLRHAALWPKTSRARREPSSGTAVEQPAAAAFAIRATAFEQLGGFDERFQPAWFEDVDLCRRARDHGLAFLYRPESEFTHGLGATVSKLGYGRFLWCYYRNLLRYLRKHHGRLWSGAARTLLPITAIARIALLPLRAPARSCSRADALAGLCRLALGAISGWRLPSDPAADSPPRGSS